MSVRIRPARPEDIEAVLSLWAHTDVEPTVTDDRAGVLRLLAHDNDALLVAERDDQVAGTLIATWDGWRGTMWRLAVGPDHRRQGIAWTLVAAAEQRLRALGATRIATFVVTTDDTPGAFWASCGYQAQAHRRRFVKDLHPRSDAGPYPSPDEAVPSRRPEPLTPQPGGWNNRAQVDAYLARVDRLPRVAGEELLADLLPPHPERVLDLGCGDGRLAALVMSARPSVRSVLAIDTSPPMLHRARHRFAHDPRAQVLDRDLRAPLGDLGTFDVVVSGCAIHHLTDDRKRSLLEEIAHHLRPDGLFANLDVVQSATPALHAQFLTAIGRDADDPEDQLSPVDTQLAWMRDAGLDQVDCLWRWRGLALLTGSSAPRRPGEDE